MSQEPAENVLGVVDGGMEGGAGLDPLSVQVHSTQRTTVTTHTQQRVYTYTHISKVVEIMHVTFGRTGQ